MNRIVINQLTKTYDPGKDWEVKALRGIDLTLQPGHSYALMGASGSGKSTLLHLLAGIDIPTSGEYHWDDTCVSSLSNRKRTKFRVSHIGMVMQNYGLVSEMSVLDNCIAPAIFAGASFAQARKRGKAVLERIGILSLASRQAGKLSGGQKQRVAIARALINQPALLIADEPTGALDTQTSKEVTDVLLQCVTPDTIVLIATHNPELAQQCNKTLMIRDGIIQSAVS